MNKKQYIDALKKSLKGINAQSRDNIILEIKSLISESNTHESIEERFGSPRDLAKQYLQGETIQPTVSAKVMGVSKKLFIGIGIGVSLLIAGLGLFAWYYSQDSFDYADTSAKELNLTGKNWHSVDWDSEINIEADQARAVIYWHDAAKLSWNCGESYEFTPKPNNVIKIRHDQCLFFIPKQTIRLALKQADIVLVKPQANVQIKLNQSKLRIAEKDSQYQFEINATRSNVGNFTSHKDSPITIKLQAEESQIEAYNY